MLCCLLPAARRRIDGGRTNAVSPTPRPIRASAELLITYCFHPSYCESARESSPGRAEAWLLQSRMAGRPGPTHRSAPTTCPYSVGADLCVGPGGDPGCPELCNSHA